MKKRGSTFYDLGRLWRHVEDRRRRQFGLLLALMMVVSVAEIVSIGAVLPFLAVLSDPAKAFGYAPAKSVIEVLGVASPDQLLLPLTLIFGAAAIFAGVMRLLLLWASTRFSYATGADLSLNIYRRTLYQAYAVHIARNSSEVVNGIVGKTNTVTSVLMLVLNLMSASIILVAILITLIAIDPVTALAAFGGFGVLYGVVGCLTHRRLLQDSQRIAKESTQVLKNLQEGLGGIRDVLIYGSQAVYCRAYRSADVPLRRALGNNVFVGASPRYMMEALGMVLIAGLAYTLTRSSDGVANAIPILGALALGAQRLLPMLQQAYGAWAGIQGGRVSLSDTLELLDQPLPEYANHPVAKPLTFNDEIRLKQIAFRYSAEAPYIFQNVNLTIEKGSRVGFVGATGSGKSTLLDILMGLLPPSKGTLAIDDQTIDIDNHRAWQAHIAHVSQEIFLADAPIEENIAFGEPKEQIDRSRVREAARRAQIADFVESLPRQYAELVGERGVRLSGGQRQRIGIARALYRHADVIVFDEATSALDSDTEQAVMRAVEQLGGNLTILIIAHRVTTLRNCSDIYRFDDRGNLARISYADLLPQAHEALVAAR
jgi:ATP-binding cassette, subfamily B, bacterial PglK